MSDRDELADLIDENSCLDWAESAAVADAIMAAGWMSPGALQRLADLVADEPTPFCVRCTSAVCVCGVGR